MSLATGTSFMKSMETESIESRDKYHGMLCKIVARFPHQSLEQFAKASNIQLSNLQEILCNREHNATKEEKDWIQMIYFKDYEKQVTNGSGRLHAGEPARRVMAYSKTLETHYGVTIHQILNATGLKSPSAHNVLNKWVRTGFVTKRNDKYFFNHKENRT